jgi:hypothetical protein
MGRAPNLKSKAIAIGEKDETPIIGITFTPM